MANRKVFLQLSDNDDVWGGWEEATDYDVKGKHGNDKLYGYKGNDILSGDDGDDEIYGSLGNDKLFGGNGRDKLFGGEGDDEIDGGAGDDEIYGEGGQNILRGGTGQDLIFGGDAADNITGGLGQDTLFGNGGDDLIKGNEAADTLYGGTGDDTLEGNDDDDTLYGEDGHDVISGNDGNDTVHGGTGDDVISGNEDADVLFGNEGEDHLNGGSENDSLYGGSENDVLIGGTGHDALYGEAGDDTLVGVGLNETGSNFGIHTVDTFVGGAGYDVFVLGDATTAFYNDGNANTVGENDYALIKDFNRFEDTIALGGSASDYVVSALPPSLKNSFSQVPTAGLYLDTDGSGDWNATDELIAVVEKLAPESLVLESAYFQFTDSPPHETWHPTADAGWEMVFSDEFDATTLNSQKWNTRYGHTIYEGRTNPWNAEQQAYVGDDEVIDGVTYDAFDFGNGVLSQGYFILDRLGKPKWSR